MHTDVDQGPIKYLFQVLAHHASTQDSVDRYEIGMMVGLMTDDSDTHDAQTNPISTPSTLKI